MGVIGEPVLWLMITVIDLYTWIVIIGVILSWLVAFNVINTSNKFVYMVGDFTSKATEPALRQIRGYMPSIGGMDLAPMVLILGLFFIKKVIVNFYVQMM